MPKQSKRELIIQEAALIFKQKGYSATSMRELAEKVGMEAASLYNHIRSKDEISMYLIKTLLPNRLRNASPVSLKTRKETLLSVLT